MAGVGDDKSAVRLTPGPAPACLQDLYAALDEALTAWGDVEVAPLLHYIAYRRIVNLASVIFRPKHEAMLVYLRVDPDTVALEEGFSRDMRGVGHLGTGDLEVRIGSAADLEKAGLSGAMPSSVVPGYAKTSRPPRGLAGQPSAGNDASTYTTPSSHWLADSSAGEDSDDGVRDRLSPRTLISRD